MSEKHLGKIESVHFGYTGYQDMQFGLSLAFSFGGMGVQTTIGNAWSLDMKVDKYTKWTEEDRDIEFAKTMREINRIMKEAKVTDVYKLKGIPVEVEIDRGTFKSFRVLTEVL